MKITYRQMTIEDYDAVFALWQESEGVTLRDSDSRTSLENYLARNPGSSFVASHGDEIVGAVLCGHDGRRGYLYHLAVARSYRSRHIGKTLVEKSLQVIEKQGVYKIMIAVNRDNQPGIDFWQFNGWVARDDLLLMQMTASDKPNA